MANNKFGGVLQSQGYINRKYNNRHGYVVRQNLDIDNQRKMQAREAVEINSLNNDVGYETNADMIF